MNSKQNLLAGGGGHLVLVADNCTGQNKNRMVMRFVVWLVEKKFFAKVSLIFLVAGHTKNPCDRLFNLLKGEYRRRNIYNVDDLLKILDSHTMCSAERAPKFFGWDKYLDELYQVPQGILKHHCFAVFEQRPTTIVMKRSDVCEYHVEVDVKLSANKVNDEQREQVLSEMPNKTKAPGIRLIKRVGRYKNYRQFVPDNYKDDELYKRG